ncbi:MAG TPA: tail fiber protein [Frankiaceae bacterium]|jgi:microcystin-dependent protein|nr:tail fiber protein [Frankiaceae bacterium]
MADPFVAEVRAFCFNFAPKGWAFCNGQLLPISQNTALFSLLGTYYGGDGKSTFALPDLTGCRVPMGQGQGQGLSDRVLGEVGGNPYVTLIDSELPMHPHSLNATSTPADVSSPTPTTALARTTGKPGYAAPASLTQLNVQTIGPAGGSLPHNNLMPYVVLSYCIALQGIFPPRQ